MRSESPISHFESLHRVAGGDTVEFWSSVEYGTFLRGLVRELRTLGWDACQRFAVTEPEYRAARSRVARWRMRWKCYVTYPRMLQRRLREEPPPAALVVCTNTFYAPAVALKAARPFGVPVVHWVFDLFPDVLVHAGKLGAGGALARKLRDSTRNTFAHAAANVFLGDRLRAHAEYRFGAIPRAVVVPVGADATPFAAASLPQRAKGAPLRILYCGNLGRMHDTATIAELVRRGLPAGCELHFRGNGVGFQQLEHALASFLTDDGRVVFGPNLDEPAWVAAMQEADVALVTMRPGTEALVMPSKTYSAMAAGQAILAIGPRDSDLARTVVQHEAGWVVEPGDVDTLTKILLAAVANRAATDVRRVNAQRATREHYDQKALAPVWARLLADVTRARVQPTPLQA